MSELQKQMFLQLTREWSIGDSWEVTYTHGCDVAFMDIKPGHPHLFIILKYKEIFSTSKDKAQRYSKDLKI